MTEVLSRQNAGGNATSAAPREFTAAELGALAHLYRGEVYRSTIWRTRLDNTTNWAVVTMGIGLSVTFSSKEASPLPLILVAFLVTMFLAFEARRYRYFNVWRARCRWIEKHLYAPILNGEPCATADWANVLGRDYRAPRYHISYMRALGRRLRRNYVWIFGIQTVAYYGKLAVHPAAVTSWSELWERAAIGPIPGQAVVIAGLVFDGLWIAFALASYYQDHAKHGERPTADAMG